MEMVGHYDEVMQAVFSFGTIRIDDINQQARRLGLL
jgi:hypothetical protein